MTDGHAATHRLDPAPLLLAAAATACSDSLPITVDNVNNDLLMKDPSFLRSSWPVADSEPAKSIRFCARKQGPGQRRQCPEPELYMPLTSLDVRAEPSSLLMLSIVCTHAHRRPSARILTRASLTLQARGTHHHENGMTP